MDEVLINTTTAGMQGQPAVCGLQGTQFVVVWEDRSDLTIKGQMFGAAGVRSSDADPDQPANPTGPEATASGDCRVRFRLRRCLDRAGARRPPCERDRPS